ncbi:MAG: glycosyltransferase family 2 protein [Acidobacteriota bacterium]|nr:glycosyltransferase family 2 protein [Acidobacteriota bacterium]
MNKISIALGTYNGARFLPEQLESFSAQTVLPDELIVSDDCSTDETAEIIREYARVAPFPVKLSENHINLGSTANFEKAILLCSGDIIFLSDQDDVWMPTKIERIAAEFEKNERLGFVFTDAELVDENLAPLGRRLCDFTFQTKHRHIKNSREMLELLLPHNYVTGATMAFRADFREFFLPFPLAVPDMIHDAWIALVTAAMAEFKFLDEPLIKYRQHDRQQIGVKFFEDVAAVKFERMVSALRASQTGKERINKIYEIFEQNPKLSDESVLIGKIKKKCLAQTDERIRHYQTRTNLPSSKINRIRAVWRELKSKRYHKFSKGFLSALKDVVADY